MVPMVFVYAPTMLIVLPEYFTLASFLQVSITCALGVFCIATAVSGYFNRPLLGIWRLAMALGGLFLVAPSTNSDLLSILFIVPVMMQQYMPAKQAASETVK